MCHYIETADHERVMELAEEWKEWKHETEADAETDDPIAAPADD